MNIRDKLKFIDQIGKPASNFEKAKAQKPLEDIIGGKIYNSTFLLEHDFEVDYVHGNFSLRDALKISPHYLQLAGKDNDLIHLDLKDTLFFDTETTGLSGGSGTYIFLAGFGYFENDRFLIKQFFLRQPGEEFAMLQAIDELFARRNSVVSFNGKSFDWPLLKSRMIFHRIWRDINDPIHLDLLHAARRVWKNSLIDCSLTSLEKEILGVQRNGDVPSWEIPQIYFDFLRDGDPTPLLPVIYHNKIDILSLVALTARLHQVHSSPLQQTRNEQELLNLANYYEKNNHLTRAIELYQEIIGCDLPQNLKLQTQLKLGYCLKKKGELHQAAQIWRQIIASGRFVFQAYEELAKYFEHHAKDLHEAKRIVVSCLSSIEVKEQLSPRFEYIQMKKSLRHRLNRLENKLTRKI